MAVKSQTKVYLILEGETLDSHTDHYSAIKTLKFILVIKNMTMTNFNTAKRLH